VNDGRRGRRDVVRIGTVVVHPRLGGQPLEMAHEIVARDTDEAAEQREALGRGLGVRRGGERAAQRGEQVGLVLRARQALGTDPQPGPVEPELEAVAEADEGIAGEPLAALHAFEQEARPERLQLQIGRDRRIEVGGDVEQACRNLRFLSREDPGDAQKNPSPVDRGDGSQDSCVRDVRDRAHS